MLPPLFNINHLHSDISAGALILVPNNRLALAINRAWGQQFSDSETSWSAPRIYTLKNWLEECWQELADRGCPAVLQGTLISSEQENCLWDQLIAQSNPPQLPSMARNAQQAFRVCQEWQISFEQLASCETPLNQWHSQFQQALNQHKLITYADFAGILSNAHRDGYVDNEATIVGYGFQTLAPVYQSLLTRVADDFTLQEPTDDHRSTDAQQTATAAAHYDSAQEIAAAAAWAKQQLQDADKNNQPIRIGVVVPELTKLRAQVERVFREQFAPESLLTNSPHSVPTFNISAGVSLAQTPLVQSAFMLLQLNRPKQTFDDYQKLLQAPFWGNKEQLAIRQEALLQLYDDGIPNPTANRFRYLVHRAEQQSVNNLSDGAQQEHNHSLAQALEKFSRIRSDGANKQSLREWFSLFKQQLACLGWPGYRTLDSIEHQQFDHWRRLNEAIQNIDHLLGSLSLGEALTQLQRLANSAIFQPETADSSVQVLGTLESAGLHFDQLWVMSVNAHQWPAPCKPNPLIPASLQRQKLAPRACPERELAIASQLIEHFQLNSLQTIFSYSQFDGDRILQPSALIEELPQGALSTPAASTLTEPADVPESTLLEYRNEAYGAPLTVTSNKPVRGGSGLFKEQAICPFNSYAKHRLGARNPDPVTFGLSPLDRGNILHQCLELIWQQLGSHTALTALDESALSDLIQQKIATTLIEWKKRRTDLFTEQFYQLECEFLHQLLTRWMVMEQQRPPFDVIATEQTVEQTFAGIPLRLRIDRIDSIQGQQIVIDYKTGASKPAINGWRGERPREPQLPLYAVLNSESCGAAFGSVNHQHLGFYGVLLENAASDSLLPPLAQPVDKDLLNPEDTLRDQWQQCLTTLAEELKSGFAAVQFQSAQDIPQGRDLWALNRWPELTMRQP